jgi:Flp pilus assembly protein TadG
VVNKGAVMKRIRNEEGIAALEFAIIFPILFVIMAGIIEFGMVLFMKEVVTNASREGARAGIIQSTPKPTAGDIQNVVQIYLTGAGLSTSNCVSSNCAAVTGACTANCFGQDLTVTVDYRYDFLILPEFVGTNLTLSASTLMKHE